MMVAAALGCPAEDEGSDGPANTGDPVGSTGDAPGDTDDPGATSQASTTSATSGDPDPSGGQDACFGGGPTIGDPCNPGDSCEYGDDCGSSIYGCVDGVWAQTGGTGCGATPIPCEEAVDGDACGQPGDVCDLDGDCLQVLECESFVWRSYEVCTQMACADAQPVEAGGTCDLPPGQFCNGAEPCEGISYNCIDGTWTAFGGGIPDGCE